MAVLCSRAGDPEETNYTTVGSAVSTITSNLNDLTQSLRLMAVLLDNENDSDNLLKVCCEGHTCCRTVVLRLSNNRLEQHGFDSRQQRRVVALFVARHFNIIYWCGPRLLL